MEEFEGGFIRSFMFWFAVTLLVSFAFVWFG